MARESQAVSITAPKFERVEFSIVGTAFYVPHKFSVSKLIALQARQSEGDTAGTRKRRAPKDFEREAVESAYRSADGRWGIPATAFRGALVSACRICKFKMTMAKLSLFIETTLSDEGTGTPIVEIEGESESFVQQVRNETGVIDLRPRMRWYPGWRATVRVRYDAEILRAEDVANLMVRAGMQVGIGDGRPDSPASVGMCWGTFEVLFEVVNG